jgi:fermentation-respiration switch protein FrsA (DUF1100 family)
MRLLFLLALAAALFLLLLWFAQRRLIYFPAREVPDPAALGLRDVEDARFTASDGVALHGWFAPAEGAPRELAVLVHHGNGGNVVDRLYLLESLSRAGLHVLAYDYRGYGRSAGSPSEAGLYRDGRAAQAWLLARTGLPPERLVQYGESLGGAVALELAAGATPPPRAVVLQSPFTSLADTAAQHYPWLPVRLLLRDRYENAAKIGRLAAPLLVLHGTADWIVPPEHGRELLRLATAAQPARLVDVPRRGHNDLWADARARTADVTGFLDALPR